MWTHCIDLAWELRVHADLLEWFHNGMGRTAVMMGEERFMGIFWITGEERRKGDCHRDLFSIGWFVKLHLDGSIAWILNIQL